MNNETLDTWQLNSILDLYGGKDNGQNINTAKEYYINHNSIKNGVVLSDKMTPVNGMHKISNAYYYYDNNDYHINDPNSNKPYSKFYPILLNDENNYVENNYKILSGKDIDFENAYLKYANQTHDYHSPIQYHELSITNGVLHAEEKTNEDYIFDREIIPYVNNTYDLLNIVDYLCNRVNCLNFLLDVIKEQKNVNI